MRIAVLIAATLFSTAASAMCVGTSSFQNCTDTSGNSYTVNRFGNNTMVQGHNSRTGSNWSQNSTTFGNTTMHQGQTNGQSWNMNQYNMGNTQLYQGTDSRGRSFSHTCINGFCN